MAAERLLHTAVRRAPLPNAASFVLYFPGMLWSSTTDDLHVVTAATAVWHRLARRAKVAARLVSYRPLVIAQVAESEHSAHKNKVIFPIDAVAAAI